MKSSAKQRQIFAAFVASMGAITIGSTIAWIDAKQYDVEYVKYLSFLFYSSAALGASLSYFIIKLRGTIFALRTTTAMFSVGWAFMTFFGDCLNEFPLARGFIGIFCGFVSGPVPLYIGEITEKEIRGACGSIFHLNLVVGAMIANLLIFHANNEMFACWCFLICTLQILLTSHIPEAPFFLLLRAQSDQAKKALCWLRGSDCDVETEFNEIEANVKEVKLNFAKRQAFCEFCIRFYRPWLRLAGLLLFQQCSGISMALYLSYYLFRNVITNFNDYMPNLIVSCLQILFVLLALCLVDVLGRRLLLIVSSVGMSVFMLTLGTCVSSDIIGWTSAAALLLFLVMFSIGYGPIPWIMMAELIPAEFKLLISSYGVGSYWTANALIALLNDLLQMHGITELELELGYVLSGFAALTLLGLVFVFIFIPETKHKTQVEIQELLK